MENFLALAKRATVAFILLAAFSCTQPANVLRLAEYMKAEKALRIRVNDQNGLQDSIATLRQKFRIDPDKEIAKMKNDPAAWKKLLETLASKK